MRRKLLGAALACCVTLAFGLAAGTASATEADVDAAKTPPMGWNSWNAYGCNVTEDGIMDASDGMRSMNLAAAGYKYVVIDDCWQGARDSAGYQTSNPGKFPHGVKFLADKAHADGLKLGIYGAPGNASCSTRSGIYKTGVGSRGHERQDAGTWASQGVDFLKYDWCNADWDHEAQTGQSAKEQQIQLFSLMRDELKATGRHITYAISQYGDYDVAQWAGDIANMWRDTGDLEPEWKSSVQWHMGILEALNKQRYYISKTAPGAWADADMLQVGNMKSQQEERTHFAMWSMLPSPLMLGTDLSKLDQEDVDLVTNPRLIAVDQDPLGKGATQVAKTDDMQVWTRPMANGDTVVAVVNTSAKSADETLDLTKYGLKGTYTAMDLWTGSTTDVTGTLTAKNLASHDTAIWRLSAGAGGVQASEATLPNYYMDNMVFQQGKPFIVKGTTDPGASVTATIGTQSATVQSDSDGKFSIAVPASPASLDPYELTVSSKGKILKDIKHVYSGDLLVAAGQSNMDASYDLFYRTDWDANLNMSDVFKRADLPTPTKDPNVRFVKTDYKYGYSPATDMPLRYSKTSWLDASDSVSRMSYVAYYTAEVLRQRHPDVPVGVLDVSWSGSSIAANLGNIWYSHMSPLEGFNIGGVVWYQGEADSNPGNPTVREQYYRTNLTTLIDKFRTAANDPNLPFVAIQLARFNSGPSSGNDDMFYPPVRNAQSQVVANTQNTAMVSTLDTDKGTDGVIHPLGKDIVGSRAGAAMADMLDGRTPRQGPIPDHATASGNTVTVTFKNGTGAGLKAMSPIYDLTASPSRYATDDPSGNIDEVEVAGSDGVFQPAKARVDGDRLVVTAQNIQGTPTQVRYAWNGVPAHPNLYNGQNLPAGTFRLDIDGATINPQRSIVFSSNGGSDTVRPLTGDKGAHARIPSNTPVRNGYTFKEWNTKRDGSGTAYHPGDAIDIPASDSTLCAIWTKNAS